MPRTVRPFLADLVALTFGFAVASLSMTVLMAARSSDPLRTTAPTASVLSPSQGQVVSGNVVVSATASQDTDTLQFQLSGANLGPAISSGACSVNWNSTAVNDGTYALTVLAFDASGNMTPSGSVAVTVVNSAPQITNVVTSNPTSTSVVINWTTNQASTSGVDYGVDSLTSSAPVNWNLVTQHSATLVGLSPGTSYRFRATSWNSAGLSGSSAEFTFATAAGDPATSDPGTPTTPPPTSAPGTPGTLISAPGSSPALPAPPPPGDTTTSPAPPPPSAPPPPPPAPPPPSAPTTIDGVAVDPVLGVLGDFIVFLDREGRDVAATVTDSDGKFRFTGLFSGHYRAWAWLGGPRILVLDVTIK